MAQRAIIYARVSGDDRGKGNLPDQLEMGRKYALNKGYQIVAKLAEDEKGASGYEMDLPQLTRALEAARNGEINVLVVRELDRFVRKLTKQLIVEQEFIQAGVRVEYVLGKYPDTAEGRLHKNIEASIAEYNREQTARRTTRKRRKIIQDGGVMVHGNPPYGYRLDKTNGKRALVVYEPEARIVRLVFTWYAEGDENNKKLGTNAIAQRLISMSVPTWKDTHAKGYKPSGYSHWSFGTISHMLNNETYIGRWYYGRRNHRTKYNPRSYWLEVEVPAIISQELWNKRGRNGKQTRQKLRGTQSAITCWDGG